MFTIIEKLDLESRTALFACVPSVYASGATALTPQHLVVAILRTPSVSEIMHRMSASVTDIVPELSPTPPQPVTMEGALALLHAFSRESYAPDGTHPNPSSPDLSPRDEWRPAGFVHLPLSSDAHNTLERLATEIAAAPPQSVSPIRVLLAFLDYDAAIRPIFERHGVGAEQVRQHLAAGGAA